MTGTQPDLQELTALCEKYSACLVLDEAHATGLHGAGLAAKAGLQQKVPIRVLTFGKAVGLAGAVVVGSSILSNLLVNLGRPFIYTTGPLPIHTRLVLKRLQWFETAGAKELILNYMAHTHTVAQVISEAVSDNSSLDYPTQPLGSPIHIVYGTQERLIELVKAGGKAGLWLKAILSPHSTHRQRMPENNRLPGASNTGH